MKRVAIMQPYFFPYIGYFQLISATDLWVVFDTPQYIRKGWVNRNRVLKKNGGVKYIGITIQKSPQETPINQIQIANYDWKRAIFDNLDYYKQVNAPNYHEVLSLLRRMFDINHNRLSEALIHFISMCCDYIQIPFNYKIYSEMNCGLNNIERPGDWAFEISKMLGASQYINPPGGRSIFDLEKFKAGGIELKFLEPGLTPYNQRNEQFEKGLSIIDVMMFNSPNEICKLINDYELK